MVSVEDAPTVQEHCPVREEKQCDGHDGEEAPVEPIGWWLHVFPLNVRIEAWVDTPPRNDLFLALKVYGIGDLEWRWPPAQPEILGRELRGPHSIRAAQ